MYRFFIFFLNLFLGILFFFGAIVNRIPDESVIEHINTNGIPVLSYIENDKNLAIYDIEGKDITKLPDDSNVVEGARKALVEMEILK